MTFWVTLSENQVIYHRGGRRVSRLCKSYAHFAVESTVFSILLKNWMRGNLRFGSVRGVISSVWAKIIMGGGGHELHSTNENATQRYLITLCRV